MKEDKLLVGWILSQNTSCLFKGAIACSHPDLCVLHFLKQICTAIFFRRVKPGQTSLCDIQKCSSTAVAPLPHTSAGQHPYQTHLRITKKFCPNRLLNSTTDINTQPGCCSANTIQKNIYMSNYSVALSHRSLQLHLQANVPSLYLHN